jgi:glycosyltransferase involved in cell wall biosynthesis
VKVLLSSYVCAPGLGSEPEVGWRALLAAASRHDVWLLTTHASAEATKRALAEEDLRPVEIVAFGAGGELTDALPPLPLQHLNYERWQRLAGARAVALQRDVGFDVAHHATLATYWARIGVAAAGVPLVIGPVGGGVECPPGLLPVLGGRGLAEYAARTVARRVGHWRPAVRQAYRGAYALAQNEETRRRLPPSLRTDVYPNSMSASVAVPAGSGPEDGDPLFDIAFVSRLVAWKGGTLAVRTLAELPPPARLVVYGGGPDRSRMLHLARALGVEERVVFADRIDRGELLVRLTRSAVLLHPALHEEAGLAVTEALAMGVPVVALRRGGPVSLQGCWPDSSCTLVEAAGVRRTVLRLAAAVEPHLGRTEGPVPPQAVVGFRERILQAYDDVAVAARTES